MIDIDPRMKDQYESYLNNCLLPLADRLLEIIEEKRVNGIQVNDVLTEMHNFNQCKPPLSPIIKFAETYEMRQTPFSIALATMKAHNPEGSNFEKASPNAVIAAAMQKIKHPYAEETKKYIRMDFYNRHDLDISKPKYPTNNPDPVDPWQEILQEQAEERRIEQEERDWEAGCGFDDAMN